MKQNKFDKTYALNWRSSLQHLIPVRNCLKVVPKHAKMIYCDKKNLSYWWLQVEKITFYFLAWNFVIF